MNKMYEYEITEAEFDKLFDENNGYLVANGKLCKYVTQTDLGHDTPGFKTIVIEVIKSL